MIKNKTVLHNPSPKELVFAAYPSIERQRNLRFSTPAHIGAAIASFLIFLDLAAQRQKSAPPKAARGNLVWTNREKNKGNGCNGKCGREMHRASPDATKITRNAMNACGIKDRTRTKVPDAVG